MGSVTYYFGFSIIAVLLTGMFIVNASYYKLNGKTIFGEKYSPGTPGYKAFEKNTTVRKIIISLILFLLLTINLIYTVHTILTQYESSYSHSVLVYVPMFIITIAFIIGFIEFNKLNKRKK